MNKTQLLAALSAKYHYVATPTVAATISPSLTRYNVLAFDLLGDVMKQIAVDFFVENEGQGNEAAYYNARLPVSAADTTFESDVKAYIAARIADNTIRGAFIQHIDRDQEVATAWGYVFNNPNLVEVKVALRRVAGVVSHTIINTVVNTGG